MRMYRYDIDSFYWNGTLLHAKLSQLWESDRRSKIPFPNGKRQFVIENERTGGFRRFRYQWEEMREEGMIWIFKSEDDIRVEILVNEGM